MGATLGAHGPDTLNPPLPPEHHDRSGRWQLPRDDLLRSRPFRRLLTSILCSSFGHQFTLLALPLTAAVLLGASPTQMGWLTALEMLPFMLFSLPAGVWLDRVRKLPVYLVGELVVAVAVASVPLMWWLGRLNMPWLYGVAFVLGTITATAGSAAQVVFTQVVPRERLVEAHARSAFAESGAEVVGPGLAGVLIKLAGAPLALLASAAMMLASALVLRGVAVEPAPATARPGFWPELVQGLRFVLRHPLLSRLALTVAVWQLCMNAALVVQILLATRVLGMDAAAVGLVYVVLGAGTVLGSGLGWRISRRLGPGPTLVLGVALCGVGWLLPALVSAGLPGRLAFATMLGCYGFGAVLVFINFLALRQAVTPAPLLGRMTSTMRWLILLPAGPGALLGGWLGEHVSLRAPLLLAGLVALLLAALAWRQPLLRQLQTLPACDDDGVPMAAPVPPATPV
jgi:MFS family permease